MQNVIFRFLYLYEGFISILLVYKGVCGARLKYSYASIFASTVGIVICETVITLNVNMIGWAFLLPFLSILNLCYFTEDKKKWLSLYIPLYIFVIVLRTISFSVYCYIFKIDGVKTDFDSMMIGFPVVLILAILCFINKPILDAEGYSRKQYVMLYLESLGMFLMLSFAQVFLLDGSAVARTHKEVGKALYVAVLISCFLLCLISLYVGFLEKHARESRDKMEQQNFLMEMQQEQIETIEKSEKEMRAFKHDLIAHLNALSALVEEGNMNKVKKYCDRLIGDTSSFKKVSYTGNAAIDGVLGRLKELADEKNIQLIIKMVVPREKIVSDYDLCIILSNILKNAIEANDHGGRIEIYTWPFNNNLCIMQSNTTDRPLQYVRGELVSHKKGKGHGFGMGNVRTIVDKYNGSFDIKNEDGIVKVEVLV